MKTILRVTAVLVLVLLNAFMVVRVFAQSTGQLQQTIADLENKISGLQNQKDSLSKQITILDSQITLTTLQIDDTKRKIADLQNEIVGLDGQITRLEGEKTQRLELALHRIPQSYKRTQASQSQFGWLLLSNNLAELITRAKYLAQLQTEDTMLYRQLQLTQNDFNERKDMREQKKKEQETLKAELDKRTLQLAQQKSEKQSLLSQTQNDESRYQTLLAQARAQLSGFASFSTSKGGGLLSGQTICDGWGCYYNQRDIQWGNLLINGSNDCNGACTMARVGCLVAVVAMVASHMGYKDILPSDIAVSDPGNYSVGTAMLMKTITVKGIRMSRVGASLSPDSVKDHPLIVGINSGPFGTHFVVIKSYKDGKYIMNDPYASGGNDKVFTDSYSLGSIFEVDRLTI